MVRDLAAGSGIADDGRGTGTWKYLGFVPALLDRVFKLLLTAIATIVLLLKMEPISYLADIATAAAFSSGDLIGLRTSLLVHAIGGLVVLLAATALAVYKPVGHGDHREAGVPGACGSR